MFLFFVFFGIGLLVFVWYFLCFFGIVFFGFCDIDYLLGLLIHLFRPWSMLMRNVRLSSVPERKEEKLLKRCGDDPASSQGEYK